MGLCLWYLIGPKQISFMCRPEWFAGRLLYVIGSSVRLFVRLSIRLSVISSRLHLKVGWLHSSKIWTVIHHRGAHPSSIDITNPFGLGRGQNVGLWAFARFWLCCHQGHPCSINKFYCPITLKGFKKYIVDSGSRGQSSRSLFLLSTRENLIGTTHITVL